MPATSPTWSRFLESHCRYPDLGILLDISRMDFPESFLSEMEPKAEKAMAAMKELEAGAIANPDEGRMVGHYWLRDSSLAPSPALKKEIEDDLTSIKTFAADIHSAQLKGSTGKPFSQVLIIGIGGSALGPQLVDECLAGPTAKIAAHFFDNTDPDGMVRNLQVLDGLLEETLVVVVSKSGGTPETRNGMLVAEKAFAQAGLDFSKHAAAVTGIGSKLDQHAESGGWIKRFPMADWVGGRTSVMSVVGLVPAALQGVDIDAFLKGAADIDAKTRALPTKENMAMLLALMWFHAGNGKGEKDMVVLPYKDRLVLFSKYLQQLVMESLGKQNDLDGNTVNQGVAVYGNKGSTDQHAYVQQLRDGVNNFFATLIEVRESGAAGASTIEVEPDTTCADFLQGFLRGTRSALSGNSRSSITISIPRPDAYYLGALIALFERATGFYATIVNINAYHQPGVEAGKKAAGEFLTLMAATRGALTSEPQTAEAIASTISRDTEDVYHALVHLSSNKEGIAGKWGASPAEDTFILG